MDEILTKIPYEKLTVIMILVVAIVGFVKGWVVPGYIYKATCAERDAQTKIAGDAVALTKRVMDGWVPPNERHRTGGDS